MSFWNQNLFFGRQIMAQERTYNFPVFGTQGGGLVQEVAPNTYTFVEKPDCPGLDIGDFMPKEWGIIPANRQAQQVIDEELFSDPLFFDQVVW
jgi:hypothetical protein